MTPHPLHIPYPVILGSQSPRRKQLLEGLGITFSIEVIPTDELFDPQMPAPEVAPYLAEKKAMCFEKKVMDNNLMVITADTIVSIGNHILNKPGSVDEATHMLQMLSGNKHTVYTGVCIFTPARKESFVCATDVYFNSLTPQEIAYYIDTCKPFDKAGSYGVQEWIGYMGIHHIEGCFFNVMGLPVNELYKRLKLYENA